MIYLKKKKKTALWKVLIADALLVGVILVIFAFFHHVLPLVVDKYKWEQEQMNAEEPVETDPKLTETEPIEENPTGSSETEVPTEPDNRTEWQKKFQEHFTEEVVLTENSYSSPEVSITIDTVVLKQNGNQITYYVADIYIASLDNFTTYTPHGDIIYYGMQDAVDMTRDSNAIIAIDGDYITAQKNGFVVRNGVVHKSDRNKGICVLYPDGSMETHDQGTYEIEDILLKEPVQVWSFGPNLLDENGKAKAEYQTISGISGVHPRSAIGYYEPGHYCFVVVDGRQKHSVGMRLTELAQIFEDLGCKIAYNMDGGASAVMLFDQERYSRPSNDGRDLGDILLITDSYYNAELEKQEGAE